MNGTWRHPAPDVSPPRGPSGVIDDVVIGAEPLPHNTVKVRWCEANVAVPWFDGQPFELPEPAKPPEWLMDAMKAGKLRAHQRGGTDHAQWDVETPGGTVSAQFDDLIVHHPDGSLSVTKLNRDRYEV